VTALHERADEGGPGVLELGPERQYKIKLICPGGTLCALLGKLMNVWQMNIGRASRRWTQSDLPLRSTTGAMPQYFWMSVASAQRDRSEPNRDRRRGANCSPAPGRLSKRKWSGVRFEKFPNLAIKFVNLIA
jgi:hypothetical protein